MTDRELKKRLKNMGIILAIFMFFILILSAYTLSSTKADLSVYDSSEYSNNLQALGINEEEFKQYLSVFGNLIVSKDSKNISALNMATNFIDEMYSGYEIQINENGNKIYSADLINKVIKELNGQYIKLENTDKDYTYDKDNNVYVQNSEKEEFPYCIEIESIEKNGEQIEVTYKLAFLTYEQIAKYQSGEDVNLAKKTVKAVIMKNNEYEYSKYFVSSIE